MFYLCSKNKGADRLRVLQKAGFLTTRLNYDPESEITPIVGLDHSRIFLPNILQRVCHFANNENTAKESSEGSNQESVNEFYLQYVQGTKPKKLQGGAKGLK